MKTRRLLRAVLVLGMATAVGVTAGAGGAQGDGCAPRASPGYTARVEAALRSGRDVWGAQLLSARGGPSLAAASARLAPLLGARTAQGQALTRSGAHYVPFSIPDGARGATTAMLHVADGSQIIARRVAGPSLDVSVGESGSEPYGSCLARLSPARLGDGWLPILTTSYRDASGSSYVQESFAARSGGRLTAFVSLRVNAERAVRLRIGELGLAVPRGTTRTLHARWTPPASPAAIDASAHAAARASVRTYWRSRLAAGTRVEVPEAEVQHAADALRSQALALTWRYGYGNPYEQVSFPEVIDVARALGEYGHRDVARAVLRTALPARPTPYPNWKMGSKLLGHGTHYRLFRDRSVLVAATPTLRRFVETLERRQERSGLLPRERFSSDVADEVYGLHAQAQVWQGLREIADAWADAGRPELARRARAVAARLERGLRDAVRRSRRGLPDGSVFVPMRLLDGRAPYPMVTESREASYWNLVAPYALASGLFAPESREAQGALRYLDLHGARLLGLVRTAAFVLYGPDAGGTRSGVNPVYGNGASRFLSDLDRPDRLVLALYGQLAAGMARGTFVGGEGTTVAPLDGAYHRATYRPPNSAANATFLATLRLLLVRETRAGLDLAFATPRAWLAPGKRIAVTRMPTRFGPVTYSIAARERSLRVRVVVPSRTPPGRLRLRLRLPPGERIGAVSPPRPVDARTQTVDLSGLRGTVELDVRRAR